MPDFSVITVGATSMLVLEGIKVLVRLFAKDFDFPTAFYTIMLPVLNIVMPFPLAWLGLEVALPDFTGGWLGIIKLILLTLLASVISLAGYAVSIKPLKEYAKLRKASKIRG